MSRLLALVAALLLLLPAAGRATTAGFHDPEIAVRVFEVPDDPRLTVVAARGPAEGVAQELLRHVGEDWAFIEAVLGHTEPSPLEIRVGYGKATFHGLQPPGVRVPGWAAGVAFSRLGVVVLDGQAAGRAGSVRTVLRHELAHVALGRLVEGRVPRWFNEGFALQVAGEWSAARSGVVARAVMARALIPLEDLDDDWPHSPTDVNLAYAQSASMVGHLLGIEEGDALRRLVARLREGEPFHPALRAAFGKPFALLEAEWKTSLQRRYGWLALFMDTELLLAGAAVVLVVGGAFTWRRRRRRLAQMEAEEAEELAWLERMEQALDAAELQGPGKPEPPDPSDDEEPPPSGGQVLH